MSRGYVDILMSEQLAIGLTIPNKIFYSQELFGQLQFEIIVNHDAVYYLEPDGLIDASYIQKINEAILAYSNYDVGDSTGSDIGSSYINIGGDLYGYGAISQLIDPNAGDFDFGVYTEATLLDRNVEDFTVGISEFAPSLRSSNHLVTVKKDGSVWFVGGYAPFDHFSRGEKYKLPFADIIDIASSVNGIKAVDNAGRLLSFGGASYTRSELLLDKNVTSVSRAPGQYENRTLVIQDNDAIWFDHDDVPPQNILDDVWSTANARNHGYAIKLDGSLWGWDYQDVRGEGSKISNLRKYLDNVVAVSCDDHAAAAICADGTLWIWGEIISWFSMKDGPGESRPIVFGNPELEIDISEPFCLLDNVLAVSICDSHAIAVKDDGNIWTWGYNQNGQLCNGNTTSSWTPQPCGLALDLSQVKKSVLGETK